LPKSAAFRGNTEVTIEDQRIGLLHEKLTEQIIGEFYQIAAELGHGFLESTYEAAMTIALRGLGLRVERQVPITVYFRGQVIGRYKADMLVESAVIVELQAGQGIDAAHEAQIINHLKATELEVGLVMNFGPRPTFKRRVFANERKALTVESSN
jgi:GxxExxY protein